jgi:hypothetical protein
MLSDDHNGLESQFGMDENEKALVFQNDLRDALLQ